MERFQKRLLFLDQLDAGCAGPALLCTAQACDRCMLRPSAAISLYERPSAGSNSPTLISRPMGFSFALGYLLGSFFACQGLPYPGNSRIGRGLERLLGYDSRDLMMTVTIARRSVNREMMISGRTGRIARTTSPST